MDKNKKQLILTSVLILFFVIAWANAIKVIKQKSKKEAGAPASLSPSVVLAPTTTGGKKPIIADSEEKGMVWIRCPFSGRIYSSVTGDIVDVTIMGILWDDETPRAIINNEVIGVNGVVGKYTIVEIKKNSVVLDDGSRISEIKLGPQL